MNLTTPLPARLIAPVGLMIELYRYWGHGCPAAAVTAGRLQPHTGTALRRYVGAEQVKEAPHDPWEVSDVDWPRRCGGCGDLAPLGAINNVFRSPLFETPTGEPGPGDLYWTRCPITYSCWTNCTGQHLMAVCPNGHHWDVSSRAANCTRASDRTHRCWVTHGEPGTPGFHVDKGRNADDTCQAGAGSIMARGIRGGADWHGFLHAGHFRLDMVPRP